MTPAETEHSSGDEASLPSEEQAPNPAQEYPKYLYLVSDQRRSAQLLTVRMLLNATEVEMEVDTGASATIMSEATCRRLWPKAKAPLLQPTQARLQTYTGEPLTVLGAIMHRRRPVSQAVRHPVAGGGARLQPNAPRERLATKDYS